jgi:hypothetical protein
VDPLGHHFHAGGRRPSDYPDASVGNTYFYLSSDLNGCGQCANNVSPTERVVIRIPLGEIQSGAT